MCSSHSDRVRHPLSRLNAPRLHCGPSIERFGSPPCPPHTHAVDAMVDLKYPSIVVPMYLHLYLSSSLSLYSYHPPTHPPTQPNPPHPTPPHPTPPHPTPPHPTPPHPTIPPPTHNHPHPPCVCMSACLPACLYVSSCICLYACLFARNGVSTTYACMHPCMYVCKCMQVCCYIFACRSVGLSVCLSMSMCARMCAHLCVLFLRFCICATAQTLLRSKVVEAIRDPGFEDSGCGRWRFEGIGGERFGA